MSKKQTLSKKPQQRTGIAFLTAALTLSFCTVATATADSAAETEIRAISICSENGCTMLDFSPTREAPKMESGPKGCKEAFSSPPTKDD